jgi:predicted PurR-regulated permease PerM
MAAPEPLAKLSGILTLASIAVVTGALYLAKGVLVPLTLAVLLSFLLSPVCDRLERWRFGRIPAVLVTALLAFTMLGVVAWMAVVQMNNLAPKMPEYQDNFQAKLHSTNDYVGGLLSKITRTTENQAPNLAPLDQTEGQQDRGDHPYSVRVITTPPSPLQVITGMFGTLLDVLGSTGIVIVLVVFFLIRREDLRDRFIRLVGKGDVTVTTQAIEDAATRVSRYLSMQLVLNVTFGVAVALGLYLIGVPSAILWGILGATLRFIPYIGAWIAAAVPIGLSLAISTGWAAPILTVALFASLELLNCRGFSSDLDGYAANRGGRHAICRQSQQLGRSGGLDCFRGHERIACCRHPRARQDFQKSRRGKPCACHACSPFTDAGIRFSVERIDTDPQMACQG